ncbi:uncharacterized protein [Miscanthus floridulus]|uniref:uncharacterized protein n=1 Tax=Miscanthus floridulus TaxID=154761 RepID=UPI0034589AC7
MMSGGGYSTLDGPKASGSVPAATGTDPSAIRFADSNLQTFPPFEARGKIAGAYRPPTDADDTFSSKGGGAGSGGRSGVERIWESVFPFRARLPRRPPRTLT